MSAERSERYLEAAFEIGERIVSEAIWDGNRCGWVGANLEETPIGPAVVYTSLGPDLYGGSCGIALVLAELYAATGEQKFRLAALGAAEHAASAVNQVAGELALGAYVGTIGVALGNARVGQVLDEEDLLVRAVQTIHSDTKPSVEVENDLLGGRAGAVIGLLSLGEIARDSSLIEQAADLGHQLRAAGVLSDTGMSWRSPALPTQANLTGFSHGTAGIACALLELHRSTGEPAFKETAELAFAYERSLYDPDARNWPDLREIASRGRPPESRPPCAVMWCHGAPGIALSRLRAGELLASQAYDEEATVALQTTYEASRGDLERGNYSLCHGLAGNAEILLEGSRLLTEEQSELPERIAENGIDRYAASGRWPGGVAGGVSPSLFLGSAGTAYFYLRLRNPSLPSVLLLAPERFRTGSGRKLAVGNSKPAMASAPRS